jgi:hypothetical protein
MSNAGQAALTIVGAGIGFLVPGIGWALGATIGSAIGSVAFPTQLPTVRGPRLEDLKAQSSQIGAPIPIVFGTYAIAGNVIWASDLIETKHKDSQGGKGGGGQQKVVSYTYAQNLAIGLCEGPIAGVRRIWANGRLIYDRTPRRDDEDDQSYERRMAANDALDGIMTVYDGTQVVADPTIESFEGVGEVPAYMDLAYVVFADLQLADYGNRAPSMLFEVYTSGAAFDVADNQFSNEQLFPWLEATRPENPLNEHHYGVVGGSGWYATVQDALDADAPGQVDYVYGYSRDYSTPNYGVSPYSGYVQQPREWKELYLFVNTAILPIDDLSYDTACDWGAAQTPEEYIWWTGRDDGGAWQMHGVYRRTTWTGSETFNCGTHAVARNSDTAIAVERLPRVPWNPIDRPDAILIPGNPNAVIIDGRVERARTWVYDNSVTYKVLQKYTLSGSPISVEKYPLNPTRPNGHPDYSDQAFWEAAYDDAVAAGQMQPGLTYGVHYPVTQSYAYVSTDASGAFDVSPVLLADIVEAICLRAGLTADQIDVADISSTCDGYAITSVMSGRDALTPLTAFGLFNGVESGQTLKFVERGGALVATLNEDDLGAHEADSARPAPIEVTRTQDVDLPRTLRLRYASPARDYQPGQQSDNRLTTYAINAVDLDLPVSMSDTRALQLAQIHLFDAWAARNGYTFALDLSALALEPTDCIGLPIDGRIERVRLVSHHYSLPSLIQIEAVRDDASGMSAEEIRASAALPLPAELPLAGPTDLVLLDLPSLRAEDNDAGYYAAGRGYLPTWSGYTVMTSFDGGTEYGTVATSTDAATVGTLTAPISSGSPEEVTLTADSGTFASATEDELDAGVNVLAVGAHGRWEILQFGSAVLSSGVWTLGDLRRGLRGTTAYETTSLAGDRAVLMSGAGIIRVPLAASLVNVEHMVKGVSLGTPVGDNAAVSFTSAGLSLQGGGLTFDSEDNITVDLSWADLIIARQVFGP